MLGSMAELPSQIGKYPVLRLLGQGAMGKVYLGEDPFIGRQVAIKVLSSEGDSEAHRRFLEEARTVGQLSHPNIVTLLEFGFHEGSPYLVMELLKGESLESWLTRPHPLSSSLRVLRDLCQAVAHAHSHDVLHRDIKPSNAQVLQDGTCKLMDFGIARSQRMKLTATGMVVGTPQFIAPEVLRDAAYTPASDTYAVGLVAYQALAGHNPFAAGNLEACLAKVLTLTPPPLASLRGDLPAELSGLIDHCLDKNPATRPKISQLLQGLDRAIGAGSGGTGWIADTAVATYALPRSTETATTPALTLPPPSRARFPQLLGLGVLLVLAGLGLFHLLVREPKPQPENPAAAQAPKESREPDPAPGATPTTVPRDQGVQAATPTPAKSASEKAAGPRPVDPAPPTAAASTPPPATTPERNEEAAIPPPRAIAVTEKAASATEPGSSAEADESATPPKAPPAATSPALEPRPETRPPAPTSTATPLTPAPVLRSLSPTQVRRGSSASLEILGEGLGPSSHVQISRGRSAATGIEIRKTRLADGKLVISLFIDSSVPLGSFTVRIVDAEGRSSNGLSLEVGL